MLSPELLSDGLSGSVVAEAAGADVMVDESSVVDAMLELDVGVEVGHAVEGPY